MVSFIVKKINNQDLLGEKLKRVRQKSGILIAEAARITGIRKDYLELLEAGSYNQLPGEVYAKCFIRTYAKFLRLDDNELVAQYCRERRVHKNVNNCGAESREPVKKISRIHFLVTPKILRNAFIVLLLLVCLSYLGYKVDAIVRPPLLNIAVPNNDLLTKEKVVVVSGQTEPQATLTINGQKIFIDDNGKFTETLDLQQGANIIKIIAKKDHSKENILYRRVVVEKIN